MVSLRSTLILTTLATAFSASNKPGSCKRENGVDVCPEDTGVCVSVQNDYTGITKAAQCTLEPACSGNQPGSCPTFSAWPATYERLEPLCAFIEPDNCQGTGEDTVDCFQQTLTLDGETRTGMGIYGCVDKKLYVERNLGVFRFFTDNQLSSCQGETEDSNLCNGQGTCAPVASGRAEYACICNKGFESSDNCLVPTSNECNSAGQCGDGGTCNVITQVCECKTDIGGTQCNACLSDQACGGFTGDVDGETAGTCNLNTGLCTCKEGFEGTFCESATGAASTAHLSSALLFLLSAWTFTSV